MSKILFLIPYPLNTAPSQRFRFEQYLFFLKEQQFEYDIKSNIDTETFKLYYSKGHTIKKVKTLLLNYAKRIGLLFNLQRYDYIFIHREASAIGPAVIEFLIAKVFRKKIIFDFDDAIWKLDVSDANKLIGWMKFPWKTSAIIRYSYKISAGNHYLATYAKQNNPNVEIIYTTIDTTYHKPIQIPHDKIRIGWTGSDTTIKHFELAQNVLSKLYEKYQDKIEIIIISNRMPEVEGFPIRFIKWKAESEILDLNSIDIGLMPLPNDEWSKGKCGFKGLQYMACGKVPVLSNVGVNPSIIQHGKNGFLANNDDEWIDIISQLIENHDLRNNIGIEARMTIENTYSVNANKQKFLNLFN